MSINNNNKEKTTNPWGEIDNITTVVLPKSSFQQKIIKHARKEEYATYTFKKKKNRKRAGRSISKLTNTINQLLQICSKT